MLLIFFGVLLLYVGAEGLVRGSARLATRFGISPLVVGLTVVAFGTSAPELVVSLSAAAGGSSDMAAGNVVGSNIFNIAVILGLTALVSPPVVHANLIRREIPVLIVATIIGFFLVLSGGVSRPSGGLLALALAAYTWYSLRVSRAEGLEGEEVVESDKGSMAKLLLMIVAGLAVLVAGAHLFVTGAVDLARAFGVSEAVVGLTIMAAGTSLPELATSMVAALRRETDVAIGNIVGSNLFNLLGILGLTALWKPLEVTGVGVRDAGLMLGVTILLLPFAFTQRRLSRPEGLVFLLIYGGYLFVLWPS